SQLEDILIFHKGYYNSSIVSLTIGQTNMCTIYELLYRLSRLKYLFLNEVYDMETSEIRWLSPSTNFKSQLLHFKFHTQQIKFNQFKALLKIVREKLRYLSFSYTNLLSSQNSDTAYVNVRQWEQLLMSIPNLSHFDLFLNILYRNDEIDLTAVETQFPANSWKKFNVVVTTPSPSYKTRLYQKKNEQILSIYTLPYPKSELYLTATAGTLVNTNGGGYHKVQKLIIDTLSMASLDRDQPPNHPPFYPHVDSVTLCYDQRTSEATAADFSRLFNLWNLKYLTITNNSISANELLTAIVEQAPRLCSLKFEGNGQLMSKIVENSTLRTFFQNQISTLNLLYDNSLIDLTTEGIIGTFSNLKKFYFCVDSSEDFYLIVPYVLRILKKLYYLYVEIYHDDFGREQQDVYKRLKKNVRNGREFQLERLSTRTVQIWL
ncbi:unnamed protein product, partial [Didymodactylos carnosus]